MIEIERGHVNNMSSFCIEKYTILLTLHFLNVKLKLNICYNAHLIGGIQMDAMSSVISANLKRIRKEKKLSLDLAAEMTGVSKSMLGQIERGESSPTVATLWKIATGLHISFTSLLETEEAEIQMISQRDLHPLLSDGGKFRLYPFFPYDESRRFEMMSIDLDPGSRSESVPHEDGTEEYAIVFQGTLKVTVGEQEYMVEAGNGIRYKANQAHIYENPGNTPLKLCMVIYYKK